MKFQKLHYRDIILPDNLYHFTKTIMCNSIMDTRRKYFIEKMRARHKKTACSQNGVRETSSLSVL